MASNAAVAAPGSAAPAREPFTPSIVFPKSDRDDDVAQVVRVVQRAHAPRALSYARGELRARIRWCPAAFPSRWTRARRASCIFVANVASSFIFIILGDVYTRPVPAIPNVALPADATHHLTLPLLF